MNGFRNWLEGRRMFRVDVFLGEISGEPHETFFVDEEEEIGPRLAGYESLYRGIEVLHRVTAEEGDASAHDNWGYD